jgi:hypothetical protein
VALLRRVTSADKGRENPFITERVNFGLVYVCVRERESIEHWGERARTNPPSTQ